MKNRKIMSKFITIKDDKLKCNHPKVSKAWVYGYSNNEQYTSFGIGICVALKEGGHEDFTNKEGKIEPCIEEANKYLQNIKVNEKK